MVEHQKQKNAQQKKNVHCWHLAHKTSFHTIKFGLIKNFVISCAHKMSFHTTKRAGMSVLFFGAPLLLCCWWALGVYCTFTASVEFFLPSPGSALLGAFPKVGAKFFRLSLGLWLAWNFFLPSQGSVWWVLFLRWAMKIPAISLSLVPRWVGATRAPHSGACGAYFSLFLCKPITIFTVPTLMPSLCAC